MNKIILLLGGLFLTTGIAFAEQTPTSLMTAQVKLIVSQPELSLFPSTVPLFDLRREKREGDGFLYTITVGDKSGKPASSLYGRLSIDINFNSVTSGEQRCANSGRLDIPISIPRGAGITLTTEPFIDNIQANSVRGALPCKISKFTANVSAIDGKTVITINAVPSQ